MMANEPLAQFLDTVLTKYRTLGTFATNPDNVVIGESKYGLVNLPDTSFPRLEGLITKLKYDGFTDQRIVNQSFRFSIAGHLRRDQDDTVDADMFDAISWGRELTQLLFTIHDDVVAGNPPCDGFIQINGYPEVFFEYELFPKITSIILIAEAEVQLTDTYTNNP